MTSSSFEQAVTLMRSGHPAEAAGLARSLLATDSHNSRLWHLLGCACLQLGQGAAATGHIRHALTLDDTNPAAWANLGRALLAAGDPALLDEAESALTRAIAAAPDDVSFHLSLAEILQAARRHDAAVAPLRRAHALAPGNPDMGATLSSALHLAGRGAEALAVIDEVLARAPGHVGAWINRGNACLLRGDVAAARAAFDRAVELAPQDSIARFNRSFAALRAGDYATGWADYEARHQRPFATLPEPLASRTLLIDQDQYAGDTFQYIRFVLPLLERGARVILSLPGRLISTLGRCFATPPGLTYHRMGTPEPDFDHRIPIASLPLLLWPTEPFAAGRVPYLKAPEDAVARWRQSLRRPGRLCVAINWQGNPDYGLDHFRSVPLEHLAPLAGLADRVDFHSVHGGDENVAAAPFALHPLPKDCDAEGAFLGTAALMQAADLVISSDTSTAHLAGALGCPLWVMVSAYPEWRWLDRRPDSPWYPTARLFRQENVGDWRPVAAEIARALKDL